MKTIKASKSRKSVSSMYAMDLNQDFDKGKHIFERQKEGRIERVLHAGGKLQDSWCNMLRLPKLGRQKERQGLEKTSSHLNTPN